MKCTVLESLGGQSCEIKIKLLPSEQRPVQLAKPFHSSDKHAVILIDITYAKAHVDTD
jgi:hypothetical protein